MTARDGAAGDPLEPPKAQCCPTTRPLARFDPVLGLEVHVELNTASKMFCGCSTAFGADPNTQVCPVCLGLPGSLPVVNAKAVESAIRIGLALNCSIAEWCRFARKNYFYPDMPKNFQISQYDEPIAYDGWTEVVLDGEVYRIGIERAHMEEDTGKSLHVGGATGRIHGADHSLLDYNRSGVPLIEIVTKPIEGTGAKAPEVARAYVAMLRDLLRALGVSDVRMEQGSLRCDANVSLRPDPDAPLGTRTETKNVNSLRSVERAVRYEITRQAAVLAGGGTVTQETRHWHEDTGVTTPGRSKEQRGGLPLLPRAGPGADRADRGSGSRSCGRPCPSRPPSVCKRISADWGFSELELRDVVSAGAVDLIEATVAAGASPQCGPQVVADRGRPARQRDRSRAGGGRDHAGAGRRDPGAGGRRARSTTSWPARCSTGCWPGRVRRPRWSPPAGWPWSPTRAPWARRWTRRSRPTPTSPTRSGPARCRRPAP